MLASQFSLTLRLVSVVSQSVLFILFGHFEAIAIAVVSNMSKGRNYSLILQKVIGQVLQNLNGVSQF